MRAEQLKESLQKEIFPIYIISGDDAYFRKICVDIFIDLVEPTFKDFNIHQFVGMADIESLFGAIETPSFASEIKVVIWRSDFGDMTSVYAEAFINFLEKYLLNPIVGNVIILVDENKYFNSIRKYAQVVDCNKLVASELLGKTRELFTQKNKQIEDYALKELIRRCDNDFLRIINEAEKLLLFVDDRIVKENDVKNIVIDSIESVIFDLSDAIMSKNAAKTYDIIDDLLIRGEKELTILAYLTANYRRAFLIKINGKNDENNAKILGVKPGAIKFLKKIAQNYTPMALKSIVEFLHQTDYNCKSGAQNFQSALQLVICKLLA